MRFFAQEAHCSVLQQPGIRAALASIQAGLLFGCGASAARPEPPTAASAMDGASTCQQMPARSTPLVVDMQATERADLEQVMQQGVAVVAYSCAGIRLLPDCVAHGSYGFMAVSRKSESVQLANSEEVRANLPFSGTQLVGMGYGMQKAIDVGYIMVGKRTTTVRTASMKELSGSCAGATHFVRSAYVGAFAMHTGTMGEIRSAVSLLGAGGESLSAKQVDRRDGDPAACTGATFDAEHPPDGCAALLRLELVSLSQNPNSHAVATTDLPPRECPPGLVLVQGKCAPARLRQPHQCKRTDPADCTTQCNAGHAGSCASLAFLYMTGRGVALDPQKALALNRRACEAGDSDGCGGLAFMLAEGQGVDHDPARAVGLFQHSCEDGDSRDCSNLGAMFARGHGVVRNPQRAAELFERGCNGGNALGCANLGLMYAMGDGIAQDSKLASTFFSRGCDGTNATACLNLGVMQAAQGTPGSYARAGALYARACEGGNAEACSKLGIMHAKGIGFGVDCSEAQRWYQQACKLGMTQTCKWSCP